jgi:hypothetical protein
VVQILEELKQRGNGVLVIDQGISVIRTLQGVLRNEGNSSGNLRLEIQHFGTISITRSGNVHSLEGERILGANPRSAVTSIEVNAQHQAGLSNSTPLAPGRGPASTSMSVSKGQEYQAITDDGEMARMNDTVFQFTSSQFPMFEM